MSVWTDDTYDLVSEFINKYLAMVRQLGLKAYVGKDVDDCVAQTEAREVFNKIYHSLREESKRREDGDEPDFTINGKAYVRSGLFEAVIDRVNVLLADCVSADTREQKEHVGQRIESFKNWSQEQKQKINKN